MFRNLIRWARVAAGGKDTGQFPLQQVSYKGKLADSLMLFPYGTHANIPPGALALMLAVEGDPDNRAALAYTPQNRPQLAEGEIAYYHPGTGTTIKLTGPDLEITTGNETAGNVTINCASATVTASDSVTIDAPETGVTGNLTVDGNALIKGAASLGEGGDPIARQGDSVEVTVTSGSSAGTYSGTITSGSGTHTAT